MDLSSIPQGAIPTAVRYAWGGTETNQAVDRLRAGWAARRDGDAYTRKHTYVWDAAGAHAAEAMRPASRDLLSQDGEPNGDDVSCCEGDGTAAVCVSAQCPLLAAEPLAPFGSLPLDPFIAEIVGGKCVCPEPQLCSA